MRRVAASRVYLNNEEFFNNHIVELFDSYVVNHYGLQDELAMTEWLGGVIVITNHELDIEKAREARNVNELFAFVDKEEESDGLLAYHITNVDLDCGEFLSNSVIARL